MSAQELAAARRIKRLARAREAVTAAAIRWHALNHPGPFDRCQQRTCYHAHPQVIR